MNLVAKMKRFAEALDALSARVAALEDSKVAIESPKPIEPATLPQPAPAKRRGRPPKVRPEG